MAIDDAHWSIERDTGVISYIGDDHGGASPTYATVIQFHRWLQGLADDAVAVGDDELDITNTDPSRRSTDNIITLINGYTISATEAEHLYDGSVIQAGGDDIWDGIVNFGNADVQIQIHQDGAVLVDDWWNFSGAGLNASAQAGISHRFMIKTRTTGVDIDGRRILGTCRRYGYTFAEFNINGTARGNNVLALSDSDDLNNNTISGTVATWSTISNTEGYANIDVDNNSVDEYYYSEWNRDTYSINQFYERMKWYSRDASQQTLYGLNGELFRGITHQVNVSASSGTGTWVEPEGLSWGLGTTAGVGQLFAVDNTAATGSTALWMQLLSGVIPTDSTVISGAGGAESACSGTVTARSVSKPFCGASTGSAIIGAYGFGIEVADLTSADKVTDLGANVITPPNYVTNTVAGLIHQEDYVLVAPWDGTTYDTNGDPDIDKAQLSLSGPISDDDRTTIIVQEGIPSDTPSTGYIRVTDDNGVERKLHYTSWVTSTFTIDTTDGNEDFVSVNAANGNDVYIAYVDELVTGSTISSDALTIGVTYVIKTVTGDDFTTVGAADNNPGTIFTATGTDAGGTGDVYTYATTATFTSVQSGSRDLVVIVRDGGSSPIKQFISSWSQTNSASTISAIRTTDA